MELNKTAPYVLGVDLGGTNVRAAVVDRAGKILGSGRAPSQATEGVRTTAGRIADAAEGAIRSAGIKADEVAGLGIGVPGHIDAANGTVIWAPNFYQDGLPYRNIVLAKPIQEQVGLPVLMGNDANVAALGEFRFGAGRSIQTMVMVTLGTGIGGAIVIDRKVIDGPAGLPPEFGCMSLDPAREDIATPVPGMVENLASASALVSRYAELRPGFEEGGAEHVFDRAKAGEPEAEQVVDEVARWLAQTVGIMANMLNIEAAILGGGMSLAGPMLAERVAAHVPRFTLIRPGRSPRVLLAELGNDAGVIGAATLALEAIDRAAPVA